MHPILNSPISLVLLVIFQHETVRWYSSLTENYYKWKFIHGNGCTLGWEGENALFGIAFYSLGTSTEQVPKKNQLPGAIFHQGLMENQTRRVE